MSFSVAADFGCIAVGVPSGQISTVKGAWVDCGSATLGNARHESQRAGEYGGEQKVGGKFMVAWVSCGEAAEGVFRRGPLTLSDPPGHGGPGDA